MAEILTDADQMLAGLVTFQNLIRNEQTAAAKEELKKRKNQTDVTGRWLGFNTEGKGLVEFEGRIYVCVVISSKCKQKYAKVNLRRTRTANYVDWQ